MDENDELIENVAEAKLGYGDGQDFADMVLEHLKTSGLQQAHKEDRIVFSSVKPWPGDLVCAEGRFRQVDSDAIPSKQGGGELSAEKRAAIFIGPEFGTVSRPDLVEAAREAADANFDVLITCAFNYDAHSTDFDKLGRVPVLRARMNADLHMAADLKNTARANLFVIFGEPDFDVLEPRTMPNPGQRSNCVDVFTPTPANSVATARRTLLVHDTELQEESFCPSSLFPRRQRPLQSPQDDPQGRDQRGSVGNAPQ